MQQSGMGESAPNPVGTPGHALRWVGVGVLSGAAGLGLVWATWSRQPVATPPLPDPIRVMEAASADDPSRARTDHHTLLPLLTPSDPASVLASADAAPVASDASSADAEPGPLAWQAPMIVSPSMLGPPVPDAPPAAPVVAPSDEPSPNATAATPAAKPAKAPPTSQQAWATPRRVNINTATAAELELLPDIGPKMAGEIVAYRQKHGPFKALADVDKVKGVGPKTLAKLEPLIAFEDPAKKK